LGVEPGLFGLGSLVGEAKIVALGFKRGGNRGRR